MDELEQCKKAGTFTISPGRNIDGELTYAGPNTSLSLRDKNDFDTQAIQGRYLKGILRDLTRVSLLQCITAPVTGNAGGGSERYYFADVFPHFILHGDRQINDQERLITEVRFLVDDASVLFYDFNAFGSLIDARPFIAEIVRAKRRERENWPGANPEIPVGPNPAILYFTGKHEIFSADTVLGSVLASHCPSLSIGSPNGVSLENRIFTSIRFNQLCTFEETINHTSTLLRFVEMVVGRPQNLLNLQVVVKPNDAGPCSLDVYWSMRRRRRAPNGGCPQPADILMNAGTQPDAFARVLSNWLSRDEAWRDARQRFSSSFAEQQTYTIDRLIASANMFDILPESALPPDVPLSEGLKSATDRCSQILKELPQGPERDSVLGALGRIRKSNLKNKIRHKAKLLVEAVGERFPDLPTVIDEAVNCRNYYVHGGKPRFEYGTSGMLYFLTDTLEFVFAVSDLIEAGWDVRAWCETPTSMSHPFGRYRVGYPENLRRLQSLLPINKSE